MEAGALANPNIAHQFASQFHKREEIWPGLYSSLGQMAVLHRQAPKSPLWSAHYSPPRNMDFPFVQIDDGTGTMRPEYRGVDNDIYTHGQDKLRKLVGLRPACERGEG